MALQHHRVLFVSLEMTLADISLRAASRFSGLPLNRIVSALREHDRQPMGDRDLARWDEAQRKLMEMVLYLRIHDADTGGRDLRDVLNSAHQHRYDAIFVDHMGMLGRGQGDPFERIRTATDALRGLSRGEGTADGYRPFVCVISFLNRDGQKQQKDENEPPFPKLSDFYGASEIAYDSDVAMILQKRQQSAEDGPSHVDAFVLKNREGPCPAVLQFEGDGAIALVTERKKQDEPARHWQERDEA